MGGIGITEILMIILVPAIIILLLGFFWGKSRKK